LGPRDAGPTTTSAAAGLGLLDLPDDLLFECLSHLPPQTLGPAMLSCRHLARLLTDDALMRWRDRFFRRWGLARRSPRPLGAKTWRQAFGNWHSAAVPPYVRRFSDKFVFARGASPGGGRIFVMVRHRADGRLVPQGGADETRSVLSLIVCVHNIGPDALEVECGGARLAWKDGPGGAGPRRGTSMLAPSRVERRECVGAREGEVAGSASAPAASPRGTPGPGTAAGLSQRPLGLGSPPGAAPPPSVSPLLGSALSRPVSAREAAPTRRAEASPSPGPGGAWRAGSSGGGAAMCAGGGAGGGLCVLLPEGRVVVEVEFVLPARLVFEPEALERCEALSVPAAPPGLPAPPLWAPFDERTVWDAYLKLPGNFYSRRDNQLYTAGFDRGLL